MRWTTEREREKKMPLNSLQYWREEPPFTGTLDQRVEKVWKTSFPLNGNRTEPEQRQFFHVSLQLLGSSSLMSQMQPTTVWPLIVIHPLTWVMLSIVMTGEEVGRHGPSNTGQLTHLWCPLFTSENEGNLIPSRWHPISFGGLLNLLPSDRPCDFNHRLFHSKSPVTCDPWLSLHDWLYVSQWGVMGSAVAVQGYCCCCDGGGDSSPRFSF